MNIITDCQLSLDLDDILRGQGADPEAIRRRKPLLLMAAERALKEGRCLLHPVVQTHDVVIISRRHEHILLENGSMLTGPLVTGHLAGAQRVVAAISQLARNWKKPSPIYSVKTRSLPWRWMGWVTPRWKALPNKSVRISQNKFKLKV
jgi:hypothetical protein